MKISPYFKAFRGVVQRKFNFLRISVIITLFVNHFDIHIAKIVDFIACRGCAIYHCTAHNHSRV